MRTRPSRRGARTGPRLVTVAAMAVLCGLLAATRADAQYFGRNKVQYDNFDFRVLHTRHFDVHHYVAEQPVVDDMARLAERWEGRLTALFDHRLTGDKPVVLYGSHADFQQTNVTPGRVGSPRVPWPPATTAVSPAKRITACRAGALSTLVPVGHARTVIACTVAPGPRRAMYRTRSPRVPRRTLSPARLSAVRRKRSTCSVSAPARITNPPCSTECAPDGAWRGAACATALGARTGDERAAANVAAAMEKDRGMRTSRFGQRVGGPPRRNLSEAATARRARHVRTPVERSRTNGRGGTPAGAGNYGYNGPTP